MNENHIPFHRLLEVDPFDVKDKKGNSLKKIKGSESLLLDPERVSRENVRAMIKMAEKNRIYNRLAHLKRELRKIKPPPIRKGNISVSDIDIERAKAVPISSLMRFVRHTAQCLWHTDNHPSLYFYEKENRVHCFVCERNEDSIGVYMALNGVNFATAVRAL